MFRVLVIILSALLFTLSAHADGSFSGITLNKEQIKRLQLRNFQYKPTLDRSKRIINRALDRGLGARFAANLEANQLKAIRSLVHNHKFVGVIANFDLGTLNVSVERRIVLTPRGPLDLVLTRYGDQYVYDGDLIVPPSAILPLSDKRTVEDLKRQYPNVVFAAGYPGQFGSGTLWDDAILPFEVADDFCCRAALEEVRHYLASHTIVRLLPRDGQDNYIFFKNAEPFTTSRTDLGKQAGRNEVLIQGFHDDGTPSSLGSRVASIKHELGHELGLIHEHLRSDRDKFIARNPSCSADDLLIYLRDVWIDAGNIAFTESSAELLTPYDFSSIMHYSLVATKPDGTFLCNAWVRIDSCTGGDPTASDCIANFGSNDYTDLDLKGIHEIYASVPGAGGFLPQPDQVHSFTGDNVRLRGKRIDKCLQGLPFGQDGCNAESRDKVANAFCRAKGFQDGFAPQYEGMIGLHSAYDVVLGWTTIWGGDVISSIGCQGFTTDQESIQTGNANDDQFLGDEVRIDGRFVDRCVHGNGIIGDRCSESNQERVANAFCQHWGYASAADFTTDLANLALEINATGLDIGTNQFTNVTAVDVFTGIHCLRPAAQVNHRRFALSEIRRLNKQVDRCVHGDGISGDRCSTNNQKLVADNFCQEMGFDGADSFLTSLSPNAIAAGYHPATDDFRDVYGSLDVLSSVDCINH